MHNHMQNQLHNWPCVDLLIITCDGSVFLSVCGLASTDIKEKHNLTRIEILWPKDGINGK